MIEDFLESTFHGFFSVTRWILVNLVIEIVFYWIGRISLLVLTFGIYPRGYEAKEDETFITIFGFGVFIVLAAIAIFSN